MEEAGDRQHDDQSSEELFLIAHKVRNAPAFDVAIKMTCPHCELQEGKHFGCGECESLGYWWIISTSGHRAYPYQHINLGELAIAADLKEWVPNWAPDPPPDLPDHYPHNPTPSRSRIDVTGLLAAPAPVKIQRRF